MQAKRILGWSCALLLAGCAFDTTDPGSDPAAASSTSQELSSCKPPVPGSCDGVVCREGQLCQGGLCIADPCFNVVCREGQLCQGGACVDDLCFNVVCREGQLCEDGACVADLCFNVVCKEGQSCLNGVCVGGPNPTRGLCQRGFHWNGSPSVCACVPNG